LWSQWVRLNPLNLLLDFGDWLHVRRNRHVGQKPSPGTGGSY
jgi:hypothetical protein